MQPTSLPRGSQQAFVPQPQPQPQPQHSCVFRSPARRQQSLKHQRHSVQAAERDSLARSEVSKIFGAAEDVTIPTRLNNIPHTHQIREFFYADVTQAAKRALSAGKQRMTLRITIPELNPEMDVFRIGTLLELVREMAVELAQDGKRVKVSVQQAMGQGVFQAIGRGNLQMLPVGSGKTALLVSMSGGLPLSLSGVRKIMERMDWGNAEDFVSFGNVGADQIDDSHYYILIAPQNVVGNTIMTNLQEMVDAAEDQNKSVILLNPKLVDIPSAGGVMSVRGRKERMEFASTFDAAYHFRLLYLSSALMFPIMGAVRHVYSQPWHVYRRADLGKRQEDYQLIGSFEDEPSSSEITKLFNENQQQREEQQREQAAREGKAWWQV